MSIGCSGPLLSAVALSKRRSGPFHDRPVLGFLPQRCPIVLFGVLNVGYRTKTDLFCQPFLKVVLAKDKETGRHGDPKEWYIKGPPFVAWLQPWNSPLLRLRKPRASANPLWKLTILFDGERICVQTLPEVGYSGPLRVILPRMVSRSLGLLNPRE